MPVWCNWYIWACKPLLYIIRCDNHICCCNRIHTSDWSKKIYNVDGRSICLLHCSLIFCHYRYIKIFDQIFKENIFCDNTYFKISNQSKYIENLIITYIFISVYLSSKCIESQNASHIYAVMVRKLSIWNEWQISGFKDGCTDVWQCSSYFLLALWGNEVFILCIVI